MKKILTLTLITFFTTLMVQAQDISLPNPQTNGGMPLMEALQKRTTQRDFSEKMLSDQQLSNLLWAANGENRPNGKRTAPSARNCQEIDIYVFTAKGVYLYLPAKNILQQIEKTDHRASAVQQDFAAKAPIVLLFVANYDKMDGMNDEARTLYGATDAGYVSQNVYLYCTSEGLHTVVLGSIYRDKLKELLKFNGKAILGQAVGLAK